MQELFVPYTESLQLKQLGFNEKCFGGYLKNSNELWIGYVSSQGGEQFNRDYYILTPLYQEAFKFFRNKYKLDKIIYFDGFKKKDKILKVYSFEIIKEDSENGILTNRDDNFSEVLNKSHQDVPGNYVNDRKFERYVYDIYGYKTHEECELECLKKLIEICLK